ncbi:putative FCP1 proteiny domain-containing protein [Trifolium repens]|nr:putative FCP1 proteiny domain-containing protein [Trifolium repens]
MSKKIRKKKHRRKKKKAAVAPQENDNSNSNMICEFENTAADGPKDLQIPAIGKSVRCLKKKLLVLDVNGILADVVSAPFPKKIERDATIKNKALFKRPFCSEFLNFCFERFDVAVWSSRLQENVNRIVSCLMGDLSQKLIFCWNISQCTTTNINTLEDKCKKLVFKDLRKIWDKYDPDLPWEKGYYNESNTLLLDDSPYKGLLNPPYNSVYPYSFDCQNQRDRALGPKGNLRKYLDRLATAEDMLKFVEQNPYGQKPISETSESWDFYSRILSRLQPKKKK